MTEREFDNHFNHMFRDEEENFEEKDHVWDSVITRLDNDKTVAAPQSAVSWRRWALPLLLLLTNLGWLSVWKSTQNDVERLNTMIYSLKNQKPEWAKADLGANTNQQTTATRDTIFKTVIVTKYIHHFDTVIQIYHESKAKNAYFDDKQNAKNNINTIEKHHKSEVDLGNKNENLGTANDLPANFKNGSVENTSNIANKNTTNELQNTNENTSNIANNNAKNELQNTNENTDNIANNNAKNEIIDKREKIVDLLQPIPLLPYKKLVSKPLKIAMRRAEIDFFASPTRKPAFSLRQTLKPTGYSLSLKKGWLDLLQENINTSDGTVTGVEGDIQFNNHWSLVLGVHNANMHYFSDSKDSLFGLPKINPPAADYTLKEVETRNEVIQIQTGLKYYFRTDKKIKPYVSGIYALQATTSLEGRYEFRNDKDEKIIIYQEPEKQINSSHYIGVSIGTRYDFHKKWSANINGNYQFALKNSGILPNVVSAQVGLMYRF